MHYVVLRLHHAKWPACYSKRERPFPGPNSKAGARRDGLSGGLRKQQSHVKGKSSPHLSGLRFQRGNAVAADVTSRRDDGHRLLQMAAAHPACHWQVDVFHLTADRHLPILNGSDPPTHLSGSERITIFALKYRSGYETGRNDKERRNFCHQISQLGCTAVRR